MEEGRVRCRKCQTWIILSDKQTYSAGKWVKHKSRCSDIVYVLLSSLCSCPFTYSFIGQAIASQRLRGNSLLSMIRKPNLSMRTKLNVHSVARMLHSKGKAITILQTGMRTRRNVPSELSPALYILLANHFFGDRRPKHGAEASILSLSPIKLHDPHLLPQKIPLSLQNLVLPVAHKASNVIVRNLKRLSKIPRDPVSAQEPNQMCHLRKQPVLLGCYYFRSSLLLEASGRV